MSAELPPFKNKEHNIESGLTPLTKRHGHNLPQQILNEWNLSEALE